MPFKTAIWSIIGVYAVHWAALGIGLYDAFPSWDIPMHYGGGFAIGMLGIAVHSHLTDKHHSKGVHPVYHLLFILGFVMLVAVAWEFHEYLLDNTFGVWYGWSATQPSIGDTMLDLVMGALGGISAALVFRKHW